MTINQINENDWKVWAREMIDNAKNLNLDDYQNRLKRIDINYKKGIQAIKAQLLRNLPTDKDLPPENKDNLEKVFKKMHDESLKHFTNNEQLILSLYEVKRDNEQEFRILGEYIK